MHSILAGDAHPTS